MAEKKGMSLSGATARREARHKEKAAEQRSSIATKAKAKSTSSSGKDEEEDIIDEDILSDIEENSKKSNLVYIVVGVLLVVAVGFAFVLFAGRDKPSTDSETPPAQQQQQPVQQEQEQVEEVTPGIPSGMGTQDFSQNTNMNNSDVLTNPDQYVEDIFGLTTRVDYKVKSISNVADFVSYEKHRGTWGGGLELYWLDVEYKDKKYVVQVPFKYYKELDDIGIVPVSMEVLTITNQADGANLTVISYMCLDEKVLQEVLKQQNK